MADRDLVGRFVRRSLRARRATWLLTILAIVWAGLGLSRLRVDFQPNAFFADAHPLARAWDEHRDRWGTEAEQILVVATVAEGSVLEAAHRRTLSELVDDLRGVEGLGEVQGLPPRLAQAEDLRRWQPTLLSEDRRTAALVLELPKPDADIASLRVILDRVSATVDRHEQDAGLDLQLAGLPAVRVAFVAASMRDQLRLVGMALLGMTALLVFAYRSWPAALLPMVGAVGPTLLLAGAMGLAGTPVNLLNQVYFTLVPALAIADGIHLLQRYCELLAHHPPRMVPRRARTRAAARAATEVGRACFLTTATSGVAFAALATADTPVVRSFGIWAAAGIGLSYLFFLAVLPKVLIALVRRSPSTMPTGGRGHWVTVHPRLVALLGVGLTAIVCLGARGLPREARISATLQPNHPVQQASSTVDTQLGGVLWGAIDLENIGPQDGAEIQNRVQAQPFVRWTRVQSDGGHRRLVFGMADPGLRAYQVFRRGTEQDLRLAGAATPHVIGRASLAYASMDRVIADLWDSLPLVGAMVLALTLLVIGRRRLVLALVVVNIFPLAAGLCAMRIFGWPLDLGAIVVFSMAIGIVIDDSIHFVARFQKELGRHGRPALAARTTVATSGRGILVTSLCLALGFGLQTASSVPQIVVIGAVGTIVVITACFADLVLLPAAAVALCRLPPARWKVHPGGTSEGAPSRGATVP